MSEAAWLKEWFLKNTHMLESDLDGKGDENYFENKWIDSLKFINLIADVEDQFSIQFSNDQFQDRSFSSFNGLVHVIHQARAAK